MPAIDHATLSVRNALGLREIDLELSGLVIVFGPNGSGKSALIDAIRATTGCSPTLGMPKKSAGALVTIGESGGSISLATESGATEVRFPSGETSSTGLPISLGVISAGIDVWSRMSPRDRAKTLGSSVQIQPTISDLRSDLIPASHINSDLPSSVYDRTAASEYGLNDRFEKWMASLWSDIQANGWDTEHKRASDRGAELKGSWRAIAGEQYGSAKAESWQPRAWSQDLTGQSAESLDAIVVAAEAELEHAVGSAAISADRLHELRLVVEASAAGPAIADLQAAVTAADAEIAAARAKIAALPVPTGSNTGSCPHCGKDVLASRDAATGAVVLRKSDQPPASLTEITARTAADKSAREKIASLEKQRQYHADAVTKRAAQIAEADRAAAALAAPASSGPASDVDAKRQALTLAKAQRDAWKAKQTADRYHREVIKNQKIIDALAPEGVRKAAMVRGLVAINMKLSEFCAAAQWPSIRITQDLEAEFCGRLVRLSRGERMRCDVAIQCVLTKLSGGNFVLIDDSEAIHATARGGMLKAMHKFGVGGVIAMTEDNPQRVPALPPAIGKTVRLEKGSVVQ